MKICEAGCFAMRAKGPWTIVRLEFLNAEAAQLAVTLKKNFEELVG